MANNVPADNITNEQANAIQYILHECPYANMKHNGKYTVTDIVLYMENIQDVEKVIKYFKEGFEPNEIISIINKSDELITLMYDLIINQGVERGTVKCQTEPKVQTPWVLHLTCRRYHFATLKPGLKIGT
jgi:hypothetical protein